MGSIEGDVDYWPGGYPYVIQGTVAEDATGGTHLCTLTVTPGAGNEIEVMYGSVKIGNTATTQVPSAWIDDGTNVLTYLLFGSGLSAASLTKSFPTLTAAETAASGSSIQAPAKLIVSGTMRLVLQVSTAAVSVTQTFAVVCRVRADAPTSTLADTVGTPVLTFNTKGFF